MARTSQTGLGWGAILIAAGLTMIGLLGLPVIADNKAMMDRLRTTATPQMYTVVELGPLTRRRHRYSVVLQGPEKRRVHMSLVFSNTKAQAVGQQILARIGTADGPDAGIAAPEDLIQAGWWHWYWSLVTCFALALLCLVFGIVQLRKPPADPHR